MSEPTPRFDAETATSGAVSKEGAYVIEFVADEQRLWVTFPVEALASLRTLCSELDALRYDAKNGVTNRWHVIVDQ